MSGLAEWYVAFVECGSGVRASVGVGGIETAAEAVAVARARLEAGEGVLDADGSLPSVSDADWEFDSIELISEHPVWDVEAGGVGVEEPLAPV